MEVYPTGVRCEIGKHPHRQFGNAYPPHDGAAAQSMCSLGCDAYFVIHYVESERYIDIGKDACYNIYVESE